jgi:FixJ family two-component response regulator
LPNFDIDLLNGPTGESATTDSKEDRTPILVFNLPKGNSWFSRRGVQNLMSVENSRGEIFLLEDDPAVRQTISILLKAAAYRVVCFANGEALLASARVQSPLCILLDICIPGRSGLDVLEELRELDHPSPIVMISGNGNVAAVVRAMKGGAHDFIEKPFGGRDLVKRIEDVIEQALHETRPAMTPEIRGGRQPLTARERQILQLLSSGHRNKSIGLLLRISPRTVEDHRAHIMRKLGAKSPADLFRLALLDDGGKQREHSNPGIGAASSALRLPKGRNLPAN